MKLCATRAVISVVVSLAERSVTSYVQPATVGRQVTKKTVVASSSGFSVVAAPVSVQLGK